MSMKLYIWLFIIFTFSLSAKVQIIPVSPSPEPQNTRIYIVYPEKGQMLGSDNYWIQIKVRGFPLGVMTETERGKELANFDQGQSIHVVIDDNQYFARTGPSVDPFDEDGNYYESMYKFNIPIHLSQGKHILRVFPARSFGESLKEEGSFASSYFFVQNKSVIQDVNLSQPYITYNEPSGNFYLNENRPVLLDFLVTNCVLSNDGYKVKVTLDKDMTRIISTWLPYYIYGLNKGNHTIRLQLVDKDMKQVNGFFNDITRSFSIK
jgi:hypothetical protein